MRPTTASNQASPLVSVIIPCYKQARYLGEAIESVLAQTYEHHEIIVIDDGSPDNTSVVAARYAGVRCIRKENGGLAEARNTGIGEAHGEWLVFLDADDRLLPNALQAGLNCAADKPEARLVFGRYQCMDEEGIVRGRPSIRYEGAGYYAEMLAVNIIGMVAAVMYHRDVFPRIGMFHARVSPAADYDMYLRITREFPCHHHDAIITEYRIYDTSMSHDYAIMLEAVLVSLRNQWTHVKGNAFYEAQYRKGHAFWRGYYGEMLFLDLQLRAKNLANLRRLLRDLGYLLYYYPTAIPLHAFSRLQKFAAKFGLVQMPSDESSN
jgi:glycosyltransferase involved in cell wall biosynthesis